MPAGDIWQALLNRRMLACVFTGLASGLPFFLLLQLIPVWLRTENVSLGEIGLLTLVQLPYAWKFLWAPLLDRYYLSALDRRKGWIALLMLALAVSVGALGWFQPAGELTAITVVAVLLAFFSATLDIVIDAYRRELLPDPELGLGNAIHIQAYRIAGLIPVSLGLVIADISDWRTVFLVMAGFMAAGAFVSLFLVRLPPAEPVPARSLGAAFVVPFREYFTRRGLRPGLLVLAFLTLYKLGDSMATALSSALFVDLGFEKMEIGLIAKNAALWPSIAGAILGGLAMVKLGINRALWIFGFVQWITIFGFVWLSTTYHDPVALTLVLAGEYLGVGLGTAAFVAFIARETAPSMAATQFALFTAVAAVPRILAGSITGFLVEGNAGLEPGMAPTLPMRALTFMGFPDAGLGWTGFFWLCAALALPGLALLWWLAPFRAASAGSQAPGRPPG